MISGETAHSAETKRSYNANIVSTTQDEAADKLKVGMMLHSSIPNEFADYGLKAELYRNAEDALAFHRPPDTSTIISKPGTSAIRGGKKDMYYDEAAHIAQFEKLWQAGLPAITRGSGRVTVLSTPLGQSGLFYDLWREPSWSKHLIPWWESRFMVKGAEGSVSPYEAVAEAMLYAPAMSTPDRVRKYGSQKLQDIFISGMKENVESFQTEYECIFVDETDSYFSWDLIVGCADDKLPIYRDFPVHKEWEGDISIGVDLAKKRDQTVFTVVQHLPDDMKRVIYVSSSRKDYSVQFEDLRELVQVSGASRVSIDATGPGAMFAEKAQNEGFGRPVMVEAIVFDRAKKEKWATTFKGNMQEGTIAFPRHRDLMDQIHGVKRTKTENNFYKFAGDHDDYFWSLVLALYGEGRRPVRFFSL